MQLGLFEMVDKEFAIFDSFCLPVIQTVAKLLVSN